MKYNWIIFISIFAVANTLSLYDIFNKPKWISFKKNYNKTYDSRKEERFRYHVFMQNEMKISNHNRRYDLGEVSYKLGPNQFSDLLHKEFLKMFIGINSTSRKSATNYDDVLETEPYAIKNEELEKFYSAYLPMFVDWRQNGSVTEVKDQGWCDSAWAFATTGALESQRFFKTGVLVKLSEQNLLDCTGPYNNSGCDGGNVESSFRYVEDNSGIDIELGYPYKAAVGICNFSNAIKSNVTIRSVVKIRPMEWLLETAIATVGPMAVRIDASLDTFQFYSSGIYYDFACSKTNGKHYALVVGYGTDKKGLGYYIVKNSWGTTWGEDGYVRMARFRDNNCGIASNAMYPLV